jgi:hypothetical protein
MARVYEVQRYRYSSSNYKKCHKSFLLCEDRKYILLEEDFSLAGLFGTFSNL